MRSSGSVAVCPINHQLLESEIAHAITVSKPTYIIAYGKIAIVHNVDCPYPRVETDLTAPTRLQVPHYPDTRNRLASIHLSSGTTGLPKGVSLSQYNYITNVSQIWNHDPDRWTAKESVLCVTPMVHLANGTVPFFLGPWTGTRHIVMASYNTEKLGRLVQKTRPTTVQMLPAILRSVLEGLKESEREQLFGKDKWQPLQMYGLTEAGPWVAVQRVSDNLAIGQMGRLLPNMEGRLLTENGVDAPKGGPGELWIKVLILREVILTTLKLIGLLFLSMDGSTRGTSA
ncbi:hypothetical protein BJX63DRAFT_431996 [Aspergillus granulosus]|uniref:AMP-dependent synthetase/ligase domain-containing protein n=1 Tax=Aspergillus granulosus TaxID=176169 RepID=A0ABR4HD72_9EURO